MARDVGDTVRALLNTNGRTPEEAKTYRAKAAELCAKNGLKLSDFEPRQPKPREAPKARSGAGRSTYTDTAGAGFGGFNYTAQGFDFANAEFFKEHMAEILRHAARMREQEKARQWARGAAEAAERSRPKREFKTVREFVEAAYAHGKRNDKKWSYEDIARGARKKFGSETSPRVVASYVCEAKKAGRL